ATTRTRNSIGCGLPMAGLLPWAIESQIHLQRNPESKRLRHALGKLLLLILARAAAHLGRDG
ncbi:hypothetical protein, partial [Rhizobium ruizarguesonis]|uniref:hypothetical protein n=1 Tax=Rhizobium ruizarguesonis TaxID=2081791 RepID=UPI001953961F